MIADIDLLSFHDQNLANRCAGNEITENDRGEKKGGGRRKRYIPAGEVGTYRIVGTAPHTDEGEAYRFSSPHSRRARESSERGRAFGFSSFSPRLTLFGVGTPKPSCLISTVLFLHETLHSKKDYAIVYEFRAFCAEIATK